MLKNFIYTIVASAAMAASLASCSEENFTDPTPDPVGEGNVTLTFTNATASRAASDEGMNENLISKLDLFFYTADATNTEAPVAQRTVTGLTAKGTAQIKVSLSKQETDALFNGGTDGATCRMVAIANRPADVALPADIAGMTVEALRNIIVGSKFATQDGETPQESFVMFGDTDESRAGNTDITFATGDFGGTASGNVMLVRAAARIHFTAEIRDQVEVTETSSDGTTTTEYWRPKTNEISIILNNGVDNSPVEPSTATVTFDKNYFTLPAVNDQFSPGNTFDVGLTNPDGTPVLNDDGTQKTVSYTEATSKSVFYTYPNQWEISPSETHRTTLTIALPWQKYEVKENGELGEVSTFRTCYYKVPMTRGTEIVRNTDYSVTLRIDMLGSFSIEEPMEDVECSYETVDWSEVNTDVSIKDYRYLVVNQNNFTIDNAPSISIPFYSSHRVEVVDIKMTYQRYNMYGNGSEPVPVTITKTINQNTADRNNGTGVFSYELKTDAQGNNILEISHPLDMWTPYNSSNRAVDETGYGSRQAALNSLNNISYYQKTTGTAYSPYVIEATIRHYDITQSGTPFEKTITVTQYPGMYIEANKNPGGSGGGSATGYVFVNYGQYYEYSWWTGSWSLQSAANDNPSDNYPLGNANGITSSAGNANQNMYVITINTLNADSKYVIGDPRTFYTNNDLETSNDNTALPIVDVNGSAARSSIQNYGSNRNPEYGWCKPAPALYPTNGGNRTLTYYYPTRETEEYKYIVAPKIRVASSYGVCNTGRTRTQARRRCATYQENGRPAGRWRVPTLGEMEFIVNLSQTNKIPMLFSRGANYYSAQGQVAIPNNQNEVTLEVTTNNRDMSVRCVYDEWYWEQQDDIAKTVTPSVFTWGDMPKANPEGDVK